MTVNSKNKFHGGISMPDVISFQDKELVKFRYRIKFYLKICNTHKNGGEKRFAKTNAIAGKISIVSLIK